MKHSMEIETIKRLRLKKGDAIIFKHPGRLSNGAIEFLRRFGDILQEKLDLDWRPHIFVLEEGMDIDVISKEDFEDIHD